MPMLDDLFVFSATRERLRASAAGAYLDLFVGELEELKYRRGTIRLYVAAVDHFSRWLQKRGSSIGRIDEATVASFYDHLCVCRCREPYRGKRYYRRSLGLRSVRVFVELLRRHRLLPAAEAPRLPESVAGFERWMRQHRGTEERTLCNYRRVILALLKDVDGDVTRIEAKLVRDFVLHRAAAGFRKRPRADVTALRMFLRFLASTGQCPAALEGAVPNVASWRLAPLPRYLPAEDVERVIASCDPTRAIGLRDRAIILLLARLGLRAGDVRTLDFADIDWREGSVRVSGKSRRHARLPLPQDVGDVLLAYIEKGRPASPLSTVFLRHKTPCGPLRPVSISSIVRLALIRSGVDAPSFGAHLLRHSAASRMLREGVSLDQIQAVLRHASLETTTIYAKVDTTALSAIAQPWPEVATC
jgi:site-specific recombinase XerD